MSESAQQVEPGPVDAHVNPMRCAWATPPKRMLRGLRAYQKVNVQASELTCDLSGEHSE